MDNGLIFTSVGNELEEFADSLKYLRYNIIVRFFAKMRPYGCKVVIDATDKKTDKTFFNCFLKVRSWNDFEALKILLEGMQKSIEKFCEKHYTENDSDTN